MKYKLGGAGEDLSQAFTAHVVILVGPFWLAVVLS